MIRFEKSLSNPSQKTCSYNFRWLGCNGVIAFDTETTEAKMNKTSLSDKKDIDHVLFVAKRCLPKRNYPECYTYATH